MTKPYASAIIRLLQSRAVYDDDSYWPIIAQYERPIRDYFDVIGIELDLNRTEGFVRITQAESDEEEGDDKPIRLIKKYKLTYEQSLVAILLRELLEEHEGGNFKSSQRLFLSRADLLDYIELYFEGQNNRKALVNKLDLLIDKMVELGYLKIIQKNDNNADNTRYEVKTLIKVKISNEKLEEFKAKLENKAAESGNY